MANLLCKFKIVEYIDVKVINKINGKIILATKTSSTNFSSIWTNPGAKSWIKNGINISIITTRKIIIKEKQIGKIKIREQLLKDFPPKELRAIIDQGKKEIESGIIICISIFEDKVGVAVGISKDLTSKYDAVDLVKIASETLGGKGGGGRKDFAQAGGVDKNKVEKAFKEILKRIN